MLLLVALAARGSAAATRVDPALQFRSLATEHFVIHFSQGQDTQAARLAVIAEDVWKEVGGRLGLAPPRRTQVILVDQSDLANGWATPIAYNTILVTAAAPLPSDDIGHTSDWLRMVFTHEFTHIVHLDRSRSWARVVRGVFGRLPFAFPNLYLPKWQIEGLATWEESVLTGEGRLHAGDFMAIEREAARAGRMEPLDRVNGGLTDWPGGIAPYASGLGFHQFLADRSGEPTLGKLADKTAGIFPFFGSLGFKGIYGQSLGTLWREYVSTRTAQAASGSSTSEAVRLTHHGYTVVGPRFTPPACPACEPEIFYSVRNPDGFPALRALQLSSGASRQLTTRYLGSTAGVTATEVVFDQQELRRNVALLSDLFVLDRTTGDVRALSRDQRMQDPDISPDGRSIACVRETGGRRDLTIVKDWRTDAPPEVTTLVSEHGTQFSTPRWSPDGRLLAAARQRPGALSEIVVVDVATRSVTIVAASTRGRIVTPAWRPDGRAVVAAAEIDGASFDLYEFRVGPSGADQPNPTRRLTRVVGGATWPDVSPDGRTIVFVGYTPDGSDLFRIAYAPGPDAEATALAQPAVPTPPPLAADAAQPFRSSAYSPWPTLPPTSWSPVIEGTSDELRIGAFTGGYDVLGRHNYAATATWLVRAWPDDVVNDRAIPDWTISYAYDRWRPTVFASASRETFLAAGPPDANGRPTLGTSHEYEAETGVLLPFVHVRTAHRAVASILAGRIDFTPARPDGNPIETATSSRRTAVRFGWATDTSKRYGYSISSEHGVFAGATVEAADIDDLTGTNVRTTADARAYLPGFAAHHVLALRAAGGISTGDERGRRIFHLGGAAPAGDVIDFNRQAASLLRGFEEDAFAGTRVALANADYRFAIARPQRGVGTWPLFLHSVHAAVFADAGHAWSRDFRSADVKADAGGEFSFDVVAGYAIRMQVTAGGAWGHDGASNTSGAVAYIRVGRAF